MGFSLSKSVRLFSSLERLLAFIARGESSSPHCRGHGLRGTGCDSKNLSARHVTTKTFIVTSTGAGGHRYKLRLATEKLKIQTESALKINKLSEAFSVLTVGREVLLTG